MKSLRINNIDFEVRNFNDDFILLKSEEGKNLNQIGFSILKEKFDFIDEVIATEHEIYLELNHHYSAQLLAQLESLDFSLEKISRQIRIPFVPNMESSFSDILNKKNISEDMLLNSIESLEFDIAMFGFIPGFVYFNGLPDELHFSRKENPSVRVPENSLAMGGKYMGVYSQASPGGWHVIGQLVFPIYDASQPVPICLASDDKIKFERVDEEARQSLISQFSDLLDYNGLS